MTRTIYKEKIPSTDPRLKRHVNHDSLSKSFTFDTSDIPTIIDVEHKCLIDILDQGSIGSCTGHAGIYCINTMPHIQAQYPVFQPTENGARALYSAAESVDGDGPFPPNDHGSSGLSIGKVLSNKYLKIISSYQWTFTLQNALKALTKYPIIVGVNWHNDSFSPDADGRIRITGAIEGGHEIMAYKIDVANGRVWFRNSWGKSWGLNGCFYLTWQDFNTLLKERGDVVIPIPLGQSPVPITSD